MYKPKVYSRNNQEKKITQNAKTTIPKPHGKNLITKRIKKPVIQAKDTFSVEYNEEHSFKRNYPPKNKEEYNRRSSAYSFRTKKNLNNISINSGKAKLKERKTQNKISGMIEQIKMETMKIKKMQ